MENFITGFPGHEHEHRAAMLEVLGLEKYDYFFDKVISKQLLICGNVFTDIPASFLTTSSQHPMPNSSRSRD
jgi:hypothetical protein